MPTRPNADPPHDLSDSPLFHLAVLTAARRSGDKGLERVTRRRLVSLGVRIAFADEVKPKARRKGAEDV